MSIRTLSRREPALVAHAGTVPPVRCRSGPTGPAGGVLALQAAAGNRTVSRWVAQRQGPGTGTVGGRTALQVNAPAASHIIPFDRAPQSAAGERIVFNSRFTDPSPADYQLEYTTTGGHFTSATGPTSRTVAGLVSGNVDFFVPSPWDGKSAVTVILRVRKIADSSVVRTETWTFGLKERVPTTMKQLEGTGERNLPAVYTYQLGPAIPGRRRPFYQHQTILERFLSQTLANIEPDDIKPTYRTTHNLTTAAEVSAHFVSPGSGQNGTFTVDAGDGIADQHGGHPNLTNLVANLVTPKDIEVALPQTYEATPGTTLGSYTVTRVLKADGTTWKVKKG